MPLLTWRAIEAYRPKAEPYKVTLDRGLQLRIAPDGKRTLLVRYTVKGSSNERQYLCSAEMPSSGATPDFSTSALFRHSVQRPVSIRSRRRRLDGVLVVQAAQHGFRSHERTRCP